MSYHRKPRRRGAKAVRIAGECLHWSAPGVDLFRVFAVSPSLNTYTRWHWTKRHAAVDEWALAFRLGARMRPEVIGEHARSSRPVKRWMVVASFRQNILDERNLHGGFKPVEDALVRCGFLQDDSPHWLALGHHVQAINRKEKRTEILLADEEISAFELMREHNLVGKCSPELQMAARAAAASSFELHVPSPFHVSAVPYEYPPPTLPPHIPAVVLAAASLAIL